MFHYTPNKAILKNLNRIRKGQYVPNKEWNFINATIKNGPYSMYHAFSEYWAGTSFYAETLLREVPVNGIAFPVELFEVNKLK